MREPERLCIPPAEKNPFPVNSVDRAIEFLTGVSLFEPATEIQMPSGGIPASVAFLRPAAAAGAGGSRDGQIGNHKKGKEAAI